MCLTERVCRGLRQIILAQEKGEVASSCICGNELGGCIKCGEFAELLGHYKLLTKDFFPRYQLKVCQCGGVREPLVQAVRLFQIMTEEGTLN